MKLDMVIEIPTGSKLKFEWDESVHMMRFKRQLLYPMVTNYGFFPNTLSPDSDPLDAILLAPSLVSNCVIEVKPIALLHIIDGDDIDDKILCVPSHNGKYKKVEDVPKHLLNEIEHYFEIYKQLDSKRNQVKGWKSLNYAKKVIREAQKAYEQNK